MFNVKTNIFLYYLFLDRTPFKKEANNEQKNKINKIPLGLGVTMRIYNFIKEFQGNTKANLKDLSNKIFIKIELIFEPSTTNV